MKYVAESYGRKVEINTRDYPKSTVKVGDVVQAWDGSWAIVLKDGKLLNDQFIANPSTKKTWVVLATEGKFPTGHFSGSNGNVFPGEKFIGGDTHKFNDVMMVQKYNPRIACFVHSSQLIVVD